MLCMLALEEHNITKEDGDLLVTEANGDVGSAAKYGKFVLPPASRLGVSDRVASHPQIVEDQADIAVQVGHFLRDAVFSIGEVVQDTDGEATEARDVLGTMAGANAAPVLIEVPVDDIVATVFGRPLAAIDFDEALWPGWFGRTAGDTECGFKRLLLGLLVDDFALDRDDLADVGDVDLGVERGTVPTPWVYLSTPWSSLSKTCRYASDLARACAESVP